MTTWKLSRGIGFAALVLWLTITISLPSQAAQRLVYPYPLPNSPNATVEVTTEHSYTGTLKIICRLHPTRALDNPLGALELQVADGTMDIVAVHVDEAFRRQGISRRLYEGAMQAVPRDVRIGRSRWAETNRKAFDKAYDSLLSRGRERGPATALEAAQTCEIPSARVMGECGWVPAEVDPASHSVIWQRRGPRTLLGVPHPTRPPNLFTGPSLQPNCGSGSPVARTYPSEGGWQLARVLEEGATWERAAAPHIGGPLRAGSPIAEVGAVSFAETIVGGVAMAYGMWAMEQAQKALWMGDEKEYGMAQWLAHASGYRIAKTSPITHRTIVFDPRATGPFYEFVDEGVTRQLRTGEQIDFLEQWENERLAAPDLGPIPLYTWHKDGGGSR